MALQQATRVDRMLRPVHRWVWGNFDRRVRKLIAFSKVEGDGGRDILRAAELTPDPLLRRLYLEHAIDELRHADLYTSYPPATRFSDQTVWPDLADEILQNNRTDRDLSLYFHIPFCRFLSPVLRLHHSDYHRSPAQSAIYLNYLEKELDRIVPRC